MSSPRPLKAVFFDRDGVLNVDHGYVHDPATMEWTPGAREAVAALTQAGILTLVVTNQAGVARGYYEEAAVARMHAAMQAELASRGGRLDALYYCPFHKDAVVEAYRHEDHPDRKPNPGMVLRGLKDWNLDPADCVLIGDNETDVEAARRAGMDGLLFRDADLLAFIRANLAERLPAEF
ncbi:MAG: HAD family hydrolase [Caulobacter sp.]|nr:HAD family hydrolase [Caulobacter sp.]